MLDLFHASASEVGYGDPGSLQQRSPPSSAWSLTLENDMFAAQDSGYTNGVGVIFAHGLFERFSRENLPIPLYRIIEHSYINTLPDRQRGVSYAFGQSMQTPKDLQSTQLQEDDVPYVGMLYGEAAFYATNAAVTDRFVLSLGVVGPASLAKQSQTFIHSVTGSDEPKGWRHQIKNEIVFRVDAQRAFRLRASDPQAWIESDVLSNVGIGLGTIRSDLYGSLLLRMGNNLAASYRIASSTPNRQPNPLAFTDSSGWYGFVGIQSAWVANDILVNGNTLTDSHSVPLDHTQMVFSIGVSGGKGSRAYTLVLANENAETFGALSITHRYK